MEKKISGKVTSINIKGYGSNSAEVVFVIKTVKGEKEAIIINTNHLPQVFASMVALLSAAYYANQIVTAGYETEISTGGGRNIAIEIETT